MAVFLVLWGLLAVSGMDSFLKPVSCSGSPLPLALIFLGVFGGSDRIQLPSASSSTPVLARSASP